MPATTATNAAQSPLGATTMRAAQVKDYGGSFDEMISVQDNVPPFSLEPGHVILKTEAVSLSPGDVRVQSGRTREVQGPPKLPYVPCGDVCGTVVSCNAKSKFAVGDRVAARFASRNYNGLAEYALVSEAVAVVVPDPISSVDAAALVSAAPAYLLGTDFIQSSDERVLVVGAGGGIGAHLVQIMRHSYPQLKVTGVGCEPKRLLQSPIGCHEAVDYNEENVYGRKVEEPFDVIIDLAGYGYAALQESVSRSPESPFIVKTASEGGRFITMVPPSGPTFDIHSIWQGLEAFLFPCLWLYAKSRLWTRSKLPKYSFALCLPETSHHVEQLFELARSGHLQAAVDGPYPFTTEGVRDAFVKQESRHPKGKVVVKMQ